MRIEKEYRKQGYFWLPDNPDNKIPGTLIIKNGGEIELETIGLFRDLFEEATSNAELDRIIGYVESDDSITLEDCYYKRWNLRITCM